MCPGPDRELVTETPRPSGGDRGVPAQRHRSGGGGCALTGLNTPCMRGWPAASAPNGPAGPRPSILQVGAIGDEEEWVTLCEEENEPDAQMLEIPDLTPYTHYR